MARMGSKGPKKPASRKEWREEVEKVKDLYKMPKRGKTRIKRNFCSFSFFPFLSFLVEIFHSLDLLFPPELRESLFLPFTTDRRPLRLKVINPIDPSEIIRLLALKLHLLILHSLHHDPVDVDQDTRLHPTN